MAYILLSNNIATGYNYYYYNSYTLRVVVHLNTNVQALLVRLVQIKVYKGFMYYLNFTMNGCCPGYKAGDVGYNIIMHEITVMNREIT